MQSVYLDNNATTPVAPEALEAVRECLETTFGNPSSLHRAGLAAERVLESAREQIAQRMGVPKAELYFCSGATEANNTIVYGVAHAYRGRGSHIVTTAVEHPSVLEPLRQLEQEGFTISYLVPHPRYGVTAGQVCDAMRADTILVSVMQVNNETGAVFPVAELARAVKARRRDTIVHSDGVQGFGKLVSPAADLDAYSVSAHKLHGPKGAGALYVRAGVRCRPLLRGGGHESGLRAGTENIPGIAGFAAAVSAAGADRERDYARVEALRGELLQVMDSIPEAVVLSPPGAVAGTLAVSFAPIPGEVMVNALSEFGVSVSTGSACAASRNKRSHVLEALGFERRLIDASVRFSLSRMTTAEEISRVAEVLRQAVKRLRPVAERVLR